MLDTGYWLLDDGSRAFGCRGQKSSRLKAESGKIRR
jgi:hypothetical protein